MNVLTQTVSPAWVLAEGEGGALGQLIDPLSFALHFLNLVILILVLYVLVYKPMKRFIAKRKEIVGEELNKIDEEKERVAKKDALLTEEKTRLEDERHDAYAAVIADARDQSGKILDLANQKAGRLLSETEKQCKAEHEQFLARHSEAIADLACGIAGRLMDKELSREEHLDLIEKGLEEADRLGL